MSERSLIEWTWRTWNPVRGCSRVSEGCRHCYAERAAIRQVHGAYKDLVRSTAGGPRWTGKVVLDQRKLVEPGTWRTRQLVFVNSMSDLFHENLTPLEIARVFAAMGLAEQHEFQVLTKRAERMRELLSSGDWWHEVGQLCEEAAEFVELRSQGEMMGFDAWWHGVFERQAFPNVWLGVSVEDQATADERIPLLLSTPAATRFVSAEPLLGPVDLREFLARRLVDIEPRGAVRVPGGVSVAFDSRAIEQLSWVIVGGESGPGARSCDPEWVASIVRDCASADVPCFVKQLGAKWARAQQRLTAFDRKGGNPNEWPESLRVRRFPERVRSAGLDLMVPS